MISLAVAAAGWVGVSSPGDYAAPEFPPLPRHDPGIPGFLLFIGMSLALFVNVAKVAVTQRDPANVGLALALLSAALAMPALKSMTFITNIGLIILIAGIALSYVERRRAS